jgi:ABC-2 type transport system permease protein
MTSPTSFINRGILLNDLKRFWWIGAGYLLGLLSVPLAILTTHTQMAQPMYLQVANRDGVLRDAYSQVFSLASPTLHMALLVLVPITTGLLLFHYLQDSRAADMLHALPVKRSAIYHTHILSGLLLLIVPFLLTALASWMVIGGLGITQVGALVVLNWLGFSLLFLLLFFLTSVFAGMLTGMTTVQAALSFLLLLLPVGLSYLLLSNVRLYAYGFAYEYYAKGAFYSPFFRMVEPSTLHAGGVAVLLAICAALYLAGWYLYRRRRLEAAGDAIAFGFLRPVFQYGIAFFCTMWVGLYFFRSQDGSLGWTDVGYFLGSLIAYFLCEALLRKSPHIFDRKAVQGYGVLALAIGLLVVWLNYGLGGFEQRLPALDQVQSVYLGNGFPIVQHVTGYGIDTTGQIAPAIPAGTQGGTTGSYLPLPQPPTAYHDADSIADILALQRALVANRGREKALGLANESRLQTAPLCLVYNLKNGGHLYREYRVDLSGYTRELQPLYESSEYKYLHYPILEINPGDAQMMEIGLGEANKDVKLTDPRVVRQAVAALQSDARQRTGGEISDQPDGWDSQQPGWAYITIYFSNKRYVQTNWEKSDAHFGRFLQNIGEYANARLMPVDLQYAVVLKRTGVVVDGMDNQDMFWQYLAMSDGKDTLRVTDPAQLETCLEQYTPIGIQSENVPNHSVYQVVSSSQPYLVFFALKNGSYMAEGFAAAAVPVFVKQYFAGQQ